jgi:hypothetical protein
MTALQEREQRLLVLVRYRLFGATVRQTRILHLRQKPVDGCTYRFCKLLYCYLRHRAFSLMT